MMKKNLALRANPSRLIYWQKTKQETCKKAVPSIALPQHETSNTITYRSYKLRTRVQFFIKYFDLIQFPRALNV